MSLDVPPPETAHANAASLLTTNAVAPATCTPADANGVSTTTLNDLATNATVTSTTAQPWRWNLGAEGATNQYNDFSLDANWSDFNPKDVATDPRVAWGTGDGGFLGQGRNRCAGADLSTGDSQPTYTGALPSGAAAHTSNGYFYIWVR